MLEGITIRKLRSTFRREHLKHLQPTANQLAKILLGINSMQKELGLPVILDYDRRAKVVNFTDKGFILWRRNRKKEIIRDMIFEAQSMSES